MPPSPKDMLPIGHIAKRTGLAVSAIRFYEDKGLIRATRTASGQRRFAPRRHPPALLHPNRAGPWSHAARDRGASVGPARWPHPDRPRLEGDLAPDSRHPRRPHRHARKTARRSRRLHRLRLPQPRQMPPLQSRRPRRPREVPARATSWATALRTREADPTERWINQFSLKKCRNAAVHARQPGRSRRSPPGFRRTAAPLTTRIAPAV